MGGSWIRLEDSLFSTIHFSLYDTNVKIPAGFIYYFLMQRREQTSKIIYVFGADASCHVLSCHFMPFHAIYLLKHHHFESLISAHVIHTLPLKLFMFAQILKRWVSYHFDIINSSNAPDKHVNVDHGGIWKENYILFI